MRAWLLVTVMAGASSCGAIEPPARAWLATGLSVENVSLTCRDPLVVELSSTLDGCFASGPLESVGVFSVDEDAWLETGRFKRSVSVVELDQVLFALEQVVGEPERSEGSIGTAQFGAQLDVFCSEVHEAASWSDNELDAAERAAARPGIAEHVGTDSWAPAAEMVHFIGVLADAAAWHPPTPTAAVLTTDAP